MILEKRIDARSRVMPAGTMLAVVMLLGACRTTSTSSPPNLASAVIVRTMPHEAWQVLDGDRVVGWVVRFETSVAGERAYFSVRNEHQQELGIVDVDGRAWRYRVHQREPDWLGTGTITGGARNILGASDATRLEPVALESLSDASAPR